MGYDGAQIVLLRPQRASEPGAVLSRCHADYPSVLHAFPEAARRPRVRQATFTGIARDAARLGSAYAALADDGGVLGVAIWLAPGRYPWGTWRQLRGAGWMLKILHAA